MRTLARMRAALDAEDPERDLKRLAQIEVELERAVELAVRTGGIDAAQRKVEALEREKGDVIARIEHAPTLPSADAWRRARASGYSRTGRSALEITGLRAERPPCAARRPNRIATRRQRSDALKVPGEGASCFAAPGWASRLCMVASV